MNAAMLLSFLPLLLTVIAIFFQVRLSRRDSRWPGLIFPAFTFCESLRGVSHIVMNMTGAQAWQIAAQCANVFFSTNAATIILLGIYIVQRQKKKRRAQLDKMNVQDLG